VRGRGQDEDLITLQAARAFGLQDRLHRPEKRALIAALNSPAAPRASTSPTRPPATPPRPAAQDVVPRRGTVYVAQGAAAASPFVPKDDEVARALQARPRPDSRAAGLVDRPLPPCPRASPRL
jgi:hypothetical protein